MMQDDDLFAQHAPDNEQRFDQDRQSRASGSLATFTSRTILPVSSTMQMLVSLTETSSPANWSMLRFSFCCLRPCSRTSFHHQPEAQHPKSSAIHKLPAELPHLSSNPDIEPTPPNDGI